MVRKRRRDGWRRLPKPGEKRREPIELHRGYNYSKGRIPRIGGGPEHDVTLRGTRTARFPRARHRVIAAIAVGGLGAGIYLYFAPSISNLEDLVGAIVVAGRFLIMLVAPLLVLATLLYYYSGGLDRPLDEAMRILLVMAVLAGLVALAIALLIYLEIRATPP